MNRITFVLKMIGDRSSAIDLLRSMMSNFADACKANRITNFSVWRMEEYLFGYGESDCEVGPKCFDSVFSKLPADIKVVCPVNSMRMMYHDIGIVRADKTLIRHRVFATRLHEGCEAEYKRRHDGLVDARGDTIKEGPESNFTIWYGDGCIFGYCELVKSFDHEPTPEEHAATVAWETRGLEIMDWITDDVDWLTGLNHNPVERIL